MFCEDKPPGFVDVVKEFYSNMVGLREKTCYVRGKCISFSREKINETFNLKELKDGSKVKKFLKDPDCQKIVDLITMEKGNGILQGRTPMNLLKEAP